MIDYLTVGDRRFVSDILPPLYRVKHDIEMGSAWRIGSPEVYRLEPDHHIPLAERWQRFIVRLNPWAIGQKYRALLAYNRAFTNGTGYDEPGQPRADYINQLNLTDPLPAFDQPRICGGAVVTGRVDGAWLWLDYLDIDDSVPVVWKPWQVFHATTVSGERTIGRFPQGDGQDVLIPLIARQPVKIEMAKLQRWTSTTLPDPYRIYL